MASEGQHYADEIDYQIGWWIEKAAASGGDAGLKARNFQAQLKRDHLDKYREWLTRVECDTDKEALRLLVGYLLEARKRITAAQARGR